MARLPSTIPPFLQAVLLRLGGRRAVRTPCRRTRTLWHLHPPYSTLHLPTALAHTLAPDPPTATWPAGNTPLSLTHNPSGLQETGEGLERDMAVSYLSRLAILDAYAPRLASAAAGGAGQAPLRVFVMG